MARKKTPKENTKKQRGVPKFRRKQRAASVYFLLCTVFAVLSLVVVLVFSIPQQYIFSRTYQKEASESVLAKGRVIGYDLEDGLPQGWESGWSAYVRKLSYAHQVRVFIFTEQGEVLYPEEVTAPPTQEGSNDSSGRLPAGDAGISDGLTAAHIGKINGEQSGSVVYRGDGEYVYGQKVAIGGKAG